MAVTRREYNLAAFWTSDDVLNALETALADVGYHAPAQTGTILTFTNTAGTTIAAAKGRRYLVKQSATSGSGVNAVFDVYRTATGAISAVTLVRGGTGYAATNTITIAGADIGGTTPTDNITITVSTVSGSQGSTTTWFDKDTSSPYTWGVCCVNNNESKKLGQTYYSFQIAFTTPALAPSLFIKSGTSFQSATNVFNGVTNLDFLNSGPNTTNAIFAQAIARTNAVPIKLITYQSGIDSNFVVFQFVDLDEYGMSFADPFFLSKYNTATQPWDLDDCFTGAVYSIGKTTVSNTADSNIFITTTGFVPKRAGEYGYAGFAGTGARAITGFYESNFGRRLLAGTTSVSTTFPVIYHRSAHDLAHLPLEINPIITGIPICHVMLPVPYYLPADFGITEILSTNALGYRDIVKTGSTTEWKILQFANNLTVTTYNSSIAFVCKTVD